MTPTISIVTPSYNQGKFLEDTIRSVLAQRYTRLEYVVIDGGSTDESVEILRRHSLLLNSWCSERDQGQADALRKGFERTSGEIMGWLNSDDVLFPGALDLVGRFFSEHPDAEVLSAGAYLIDTESSPRWDRRFGMCTRGVSATFRRFQCYGQDGVFQQSTFWRRSAYLAVGGINPELQFMMDKDLFTRLAARKRFHCDETIIAGFRMHDTCKSMRMDDVRAAEERWFQHRYNPGVVGAMRYAVWNRLFRAQSLLRKIKLYVTLKCGMIALPSALWMRDVSFP